MSQEPGEPSEDEEDDDADGDAGPEEKMEDVDHTHPDTDESFTETGVYDRGKKHSKDSDDE